MLLTCNKTPQNGLVWALKAFLCFLFLVACQISEREKEKRREFTGGFKKKHIQTLFQRINYKTKPSNEHF